MIRLAIAGAGKIARDQHVPAVAGSDSFQLVAVADPHAGIDGVAHYRDIGSLLDAEPHIDAVSVCTPPQSRFGVAQQALERGRHVLLEKPPCATSSEAHELVEIAGQEKVALFAAWHAREAAAVEPARSWLAGREIRRVNVTWKEDVREWHPRQAWIWEPGGLGVFDMGINALSILTRLLPPMAVKQARLSIPANCATPIAADLELTDSRGTEVSVALDFRQTGRPTWDIEIEAFAGSCVLSRGGAVMRIGDEPVVRSADREYASLYARFEQLVRDREIDVDVEPLRLVEDALRIGRRIEVAPFEE